MRQRLGSFNGVLAAAFGTVLLAGCSVAPIPRPTEPSNATSASSAPSLLVGLWRVNDAQGEELLRLDAAAGTIATLSNDRSTPL